MTTAPLLMLAEGRRPRLRKASMTRPREIQLHMRVAALLRKRARADWQWTHIPNGELRDKRTAGKLKQMGAQAGWPDFALISPAGALYCLELKRVGETLSDAQEEFKLWSVRHGVPYVVAYTMRDALLAFAHWRCLDDDALALLATGLAP